MLYIEYWAADTNNSWSCYLFGVFCPITCFSSECVNNISINQNKFRLIQIAAIQHDSSPIATSVIGNI